jgi:hypothetical protein
VSRIEKTKYALFGKALFPEKGVVGMNWDADDVVGNWLSAPNPAKQFEENIRLKGLKGLKG